MPSSQFLEPYYRYQTLLLIKPKWRWYQKVWNTILAYTSFFHQRLDILGFLVTGIFLYQTKLVGKNYLDQYLAKGVIFVSIHSSSYPLAGKILADYYPQLKITAPFYFHRQFSIFPVFKKFFAKLGIQIVPLGGAMKRIGPALEMNQSVCLFLDAELPIKHTQMVAMYGKLVPISSGPAFLAQKYRKPIIPVYLAREAGKVVVHLLKPILVSETDSVQLITQKVATSLETMIDATISEWQVTDRFLLPELKTQA